jgi:hypothetical protein
MLLIQKASRYFSFLARNFPVMCASDEFHFMPRAEEASKYYDSIENFDPDAVSERLQQIHRFREEIEKTPVSDSDLETFTDKSLLLSNIDGILIEFEEKNVLRYNPLTYLKVAFIGIDHAVSRAAESTDVLRNRTLERMRWIPGLLKQAVKNLEYVPSSLNGSAQNMTEDCIEYIDDIKHGLSDKSGAAYRKTLDTLCEEIISSLIECKQFLATAPGGIKDTMPDPPAAGSPQTAHTIEATLHRHFLSTRNLEDVYMIGMEERTRCLAELNRLRVEIDPEQPWQKLYNDYTPAGVEKGKEPEEIFSLYRSECSRLIEFFNDKGFNVPALPRIVHTPRYLRSVRGSASFSASLPTDDPPSDYFYITVESDSPHRGILQQRTNQRLHREYKFLTAHETVPGHNLLDSRRRMLANPIRRQIESPLFYEGWACYAESLLIEYGYVDSKIELLVNQKRELWRAARCQIDAGLAAGLLDMERCIDLLQEAGFEADEARTQIDRFLLNPGYQLCYTLGRWEILQLKKKFGTTLGLENFHRTVLSAGELPFSLLEKLLAG